MIVRSPVKNNTMFESYSVELKLGHVEVILVFASRRKADENLKGEELG